MCSQLRLMQVPRHQGNFHLFRCFGGRSSLPESPMRACLSTLTTPCSIPLHQDEVPHSAQRMVTRLLTLNQYNPQQQQYPRFILKHRHQHSLSDRTRRRYCRTGRSMRSAFFNRPTCNPARRGHATTVIGMPVWMSFVVGTRRHKETNEPRYQWVFVSFEIFAMR